MLHNMDLVYFKIGWLLNILVCILNAALFVEQLKNYFIIVMILYNQRKLFDELLVLIHPNN